MRSASRSRATGAPSQQRGLGSDTYPVTDPAEHDAESKALLRLNARRLIVVEPDPSRARALAEALVTSGASVAVVGDCAADLAAAYALDADAVLVDAIELEQACRPIVEMLRRHPRVCWAPVIPVASTQLWSDGVHVSTLTAIAGQVAGAVAPAVELAVRAKGKLPHETRLETLGLNRMLRVLADTHRALRIELSGSWGSAVLELGEGKILAARACMSDLAQTLTNVEALSALLTLSSAQVRIEDGAATAPRGWNLSVSGALTRAAATALHGTERGSATETPEHASEQRPVRPSVLPTMPQISLAEAMASTAELDLLLDDAPPVTAAFELQHALDPDESGTRPRSDLAITREISLAEAMASIDATAIKPDVVSAPAAAPVPVAAAAPAPVAAAAPAPVAATVDRRSRQRARAAVAAAAGIAVLAGALLFALLVHSGGQHADRQLATSANATTLRRSASQTLQAPAQLPSAPVHAQPANAHVAVAAVDPSAAAIQGRARPGQLEQARDLVKRARRFRRAGQLELAEGAYLKALANIANYPLAIAGLARIQLERKNGVEAVRWAQELVRLQPDRSSHQLLLGDAHALNGSRAEAEQAWQRAAELGSKTARKRSSSP